MSQLSLSMRVSNLFHDYIRNHDHAATDLLIGRNESDELDVCIAQHAHLVKSNMAKNDEQYFMGLRFTRTSAISQLVVGCFSIEP